MCLFVIKSSRVFGVLLLNGIFSFMVSFWLSLWIVGSSKVPNILANERLSTMFYVGGVLTF